jgi:glycine amidinotransferase
VLRPVEKPQPVVCSYNEWDPLEEVIVGVVDHACIPAWHVALKATMPQSQWPFLIEHGGKPFPAEMIRGASEDLERFVRLLEAQGVTVRRPEVVDYARPYRTPDWECGSGLYSAMPRDILLVVGDEIIEAPVSWRSRYHEVDAYRSLLRDYFLQGARWTAAPRPLLRDELYKADYEEPTEEEPDEPLYVVNEVEPTFDAADFVRCGKDLFVQKSHVTNDLGIAWLARHLGSAYRIHVVPVRDKHPMHIDATLMPLAPGKVLVNPERLPKIPELFRSWEVLTAPAPSSAADFALCSSWISMNVLMLDETRVIVEPSEEELVRCFKRWGFETIPCPFRSFNLFGGSFHCATLDVRRRGELLSYF